MKITKPKADLEAMPIDLNEQEEYIENGTIVNQVVFQEVKEFSGVYFKNAQFRFESSKRITFVDCIFDHCDFSNNSFSNSSFLRCEFNTFRCTGLDIIDSYMKDILFNACLMDYANFSKTKTEKMIFNENQMNYSRFHDLKFKFIEFKQNELARSEFYMTSLKDIDMTSNNIEGITIALNDLRGLIVNTQQALALSGLLGIKIK